MRAEGNIDYESDSLSFLRTIWFWTALIVLVVGLGGGWIFFSRSLINSSLAQRGNEAIHLQPAPVAGHPAPDFELVSTEGETIRLSDLKGQPVVLNFWATWCAPCRAEFPEFQEAAVDNAEQAVIIGINHTSADQAERVPDFLQEYGITFPIVLDESGETVKTYEILGLPTTVFVDSEGVIDEVFTGPINKAYLEAKISELDPDL